MNYNYEIPFKKRILPLIGWLLVFSIAVSVFQVIGDLPDTLGAYPDTAGGTTIFYLLHYLAIDIGILLFMRFTKRQRPMLVTLTPAYEGNKVSFALLGLIIGLLGSVNILVPAALGGTKLTYAPENAGLILPAVLILFLQVLSEELSNRLVFFQNFRMTFENPVIAIVLTGLLFIPGHMPDNLLSAIDVFCAAVLFLVMVEYLHSTWCAIAFHFSWNLAFVLIGAYLQEDVRIWQETGDQTASGELIGLIIKAVLILGIVIYVKNKKKD